MWKWLSKLFRSSHSFQGVNLKYWHYLGRSELKYTNNGLISYRAYIYLFCRKDNHSVRKAVIPEKYFHMFVDHPWMEEIVPLWKAGEFALEEVVTYEPSNWLAKYMLDRDGLVWDKERRDWISEEKLEITSEDNVVKISFPGAKKDVDGEKKVE